MLTAAPAIGADRHRRPVVTERRCGACRAICARSPPIPKSVTALMGAGRAALDLGDAQAALTFFARAEERSPRDGRIKMWIGFGAGPARAAARRAQILRRSDRARGPGGGSRRRSRPRPRHRRRSSRAQHDYRWRFRQGRDPEVTRRLALSLAISGEREPALRLLEDQLLVRDRAAERTRALRARADRRHRRRRPDATRPRCRDRRPARWPLPGAACRPSRRPSGRSRSISASSPATAGLRRRPPTPRTTSPAPSPMRAGRIPAKARSPAGRRLPSRSRPRRAAAPAATTGSPRRSSGRRSRVRPPDPAPGIRWPARDCLRASSVAAAVPAARKRLPAQAAIDQARPVRRPGLQRQQPALGVAARQAGNAAQPAQRQAGAGRTGPGRDPGCDGFRATPAVALPQVRLRRRRSRLRRRLCLNSSSSLSPSRSRPKSGASPSSLPRFRLRLSPNRCRPKSRSPPSSPAPPPPQSEGVPAGSRLADLSATIAEIAEPERPVAQTVAPKPKPAAVAAAKKPKPAAPAEPSRVWVQIAGGAPGPRCRANLPG